MGELVVLDKRHRQPDLSHPDAARHVDTEPYEPDGGMVTERFQVSRQAFEDFARYGRADRRPRPIPEPTEEQKRRAQRQWADQAAATFWWEAQAAARQGRHQLAKAILVKRDELLEAVQAHLGEVWV